MRPAGPAGPPSASPPTSAPPFRRSRRRSTRSRLRAACTSSLPSPGSATASGPDPPPRDSVGRDRQRARPHRGCARPRGARQGRPRRSRSHRSRRDRLLMRRLRVPAALRREWIAGRAIDGGRAGPGGRRTEALNSARSGPHVIPGSHRGRRPDLGGAGPDGGCSAAGYPPILKSSNSQPFVPGFTLRTIVNETSGLSSLSAGSA
jgi:hypothetical protein